MLLRGIRHVQILPLLVAVCRLTLAFPTQTPSTMDDVGQLQVNIPHSGPVSAPTGQRHLIPCLVSLSSTPVSSSFPPIAPRVKWSVVSGGVETQILVARGERIKVNEAYKDRAAWLNITSSPDDLSLWLGDLRSSDSGHYRCEVQQGLEDASDLVQLKVKGVVFHYRDALGRYAFSFYQAQRACEAIGAQIATTDQLLAAYYDGYEQCDAGWLADQSVRYPIQMPREGCYGDMDGQPGVRNYGTMDPDDLFDVYCYVEEIDGEVFHDSIPQQLSFDEAQSHCRAAGAELATTAQLYFAWSEGLDHCSPGWLSDGSVRYPIITPRDRCGGSQPGVKTLYRFGNQTGFPEPSALHDVYCFKDRNTHTNSPMDFMATEPEDIAQDVVMLMEKDQELQLNKHPEQVELKAQSLLNFFPFFSGPSTEESLVDTHPTLMSETTESPLNTTPTVDHLQTSNETSSPTEMNYNSQHPTALTSSTVTTTEVHDSPKNTSLVPSIYNETDSQHNLNFTFHQFEPENTTSDEAHTHNQTFSDTNTEVNTQPSERPKDSQEIQEANLDFDGSQATYSETDSNNTQEESSLEVTIMTLEPMVQEEAAAEDPRQIPFLNSGLKEEDELVTQPSQITKSSFEEQTLSWANLGGSGDNSQESDLEVKANTIISTPEASTSGFTTHPPPSASTSDAPAESQTTLPNMILSSRSNHSDKLSFVILSTAPLLWDSSISSREGSSSLESEETVTMESDEKQLQPTKSQDNFVAGVSLATTESPERSDTTEVPTNPITARYQTSGYRMYLATATTGYEEASGHEPGTVTATLEEYVEVAAAIEEDVEVGRIIEEENKVNLTLEEEITVTPTLKEEIKASKTLEEHVKYFFSLVKVKVDPTLAREEGVTVTTTLEEANIAPAFEVEENIFPTLEEGENVAPTLALEEEENIAPSLEEEFTIVPTLEKEANVAPTLALEEYMNISPTLVIEEEATDAQEYEEGENVAPDHEEEPSLAPTFEEANVAPVLEERANISHTFEGEADVVPTPEGEANVTPTFEEDFTFFPLDSQTSVGWTLLSTTTGPQESMKILEHRRKTSTSAPNSASSTKPTTATTKTTTATITNPTPSTRRTWSPTTSTPKVFHKTAEPRKVPAFQPPVDQGPVDVEFSLTPPPTLLIKPNERAAVGGTGKASDACMDDPCFNGGTCTEQDGQIKCLCLPTYGGHFCQTDVEQCELGWDKFQGFCYRHFGQRLSWEVAEQHCRMLGAHLVSILTPEEQSYINSNYKEYQWTGLNDKTIEDDFRWTDGSPMLYENWYKGQPDSYFLSGEDCVVMVWHDDGRWSDVPCNYHLSYTCKKGTSSCGPPPKVRNASTFGKVRQRYETNAVVRYHCAQGFQQRLNPVIKCMSGGRWERPQVLCIPETGGPTQKPEVMSQTNSNFAAAEDDFQATKETLQYWDIKF